MWNTILDTSLICGIWINKSNFQDTIKLTPRLNKKYYVWPGVKS